MLGCKNEAVQRGGVRLLSSSGEKNSSREDERVFEQDEAKPLSLTRILRRWIGAKGGYVVRGAEGVGKRTDAWWVDEVERVKRALRRSVAGMKARMGSGGRKEALQLGDALLKKSCAM
ncbi:hypothetical protein FGB62_332g06 [Gracilaria domingensis]|nr:hypothetical protein FGB62_367g05 [Gracilaria domingensis]KAI0557200.1 hypothetical protein FGB62_332g06 [Gracilaria domingensis]